MTQTLPGVPACRVTKNGKILYEPLDSDAAMYSLIGSVKLNVPDAEGSLRVVRERIADHPIDQVDQLLPWNIIPELPIETRLAA